MSITESTKIELSMSFSASIDFQTPPERESISMTSRMNRSRSGSLIPTRHTQPRAKRPSTSATSHLCYQTNTTRSAATPAGSKSVAGRRGHLTTAPTGGGSVRQTFLTRSTNEIQRNDESVNQNWFRVVAFVAVGLLNASWLPAGAARPNILFMFTDDQPQNCLGIMGNDHIQTPHLDRLARRGTLFNNAFVTTAICCSNRACILTGQHMYRHGIKTSRLH